MLKLGDLIHLPQLDPLVEQLVADEPGLVIVAGFDPRLTSAPSPHPPHPPKMAFCPADVLPSFAS